MIDKSLGSIQPTHTPTRPDSTVGGGPFAGARKGRGEGGSEKGRRGGEGSVDLSGVFL